MVNANLQLSFSLKCLTCSHPSRLRNADIVMNIIEQWPEKVCLYRNDRDLFSLWQSLTEQGDKSLTCLNAQLKWACVFCPLLPFGSL